MRNYVTYLLMTTVRFRIIVSFSYETGTQEAASLKRSFYNNKQTVLIIQ